MRALVVLTCVIVTAGSAMAQAPVVAGSRVRLKLRGETDSRVELVGVVTQVVGDTLRVRPEGGGEVYVATPASWTQAWVAVGEHRYWARGGAIGGLVGLVGGMFIGYVVGEDCYGPPSLGDICIGRELTAVLAALGGGVAGGLIGAVVGGLFKHVNWEPFSLWGRNASVSFSQRQGRLGVEIAF